MIQAKGEGQGSCRMCEENGIWNRHWMTSLYRVDGRDGLYCASCAKKIEGAVNAGETGFKDGDSNAI